jgi:assimilatory nitrate reductase catalytic subunit
MMEMVHQMSAGVIRGLLGICNNPFVSLPHHKVVRRGYEALEFHAQSDFFLSETAERADVVLPTTAWAEDEGVMTNGEGRVIKHNKAAEPPGEARPDWWIMCELARRLGVGDKFPFSSAREVFDELRVASKGGAADYFGITYEKVEETGGVFWPCPDLDHPGTPRPFEGGRFYHPLPGLVEQTPRSWVEVHPWLGFGDGDPVRVVSRRGQATYPALVTETIRPDTVFVPYHWPVPVAANLMTIDALDPVSRMPEFKVCAVRVERGDAVDPVPAPPVPPGQTAYEPETRPLAERRSPTMPQGRGTAES